MKKLSFRDASGWLRFPQQIVTDAGLEASQVPLITKTWFPTHHRRAGSEEGSQMTLTIKYVFDPIFAQIASSSQPQLTQTA